MKEVTLTLECGCTRTDKCHPNSLMARGGGSNTITHAPCPSGHGDQRITHKEIT